MPRTIIFIVAIGVLLLALGAVFVLSWMAVYPTYTYRYRMTITVDVDGQPRSGASVIEVNVSRQPQLLSEMLPVKIAVRGEAIFVDLGESRNIVALLETEADGDFTKRVVPTHFKLSNSDLDLTKYSQLQGLWNLSLNDLPTFVTFSDLNDQGSVRLIKPEEFGQAFGAGTRLRSVTVEMTSDAVTRGIEIKLPWLTDSNTHREFWRALKTSGFRPNGSTEPAAVLKREGY